MASVPQLSKIRPGQTVPFVAGCISAHKPPKKSRGDDFSLWLSIVDETQQEPPMMVTVFRSSLQGLPGIRHAGDLILFANMKVQMYGEKLQGVASKTTAFAIYPRVGPVLPYALSAPGDRDRFRAVEISTVQRLRNWQQHGNGASIATTVSLSMGRPMLQLRDIARDVFFDCAGQVVDMQSYGGTAVVALADYTVNSALKTFNDAGVQYHVLNCTLWDNHAVDLQRLGVARGMYILLRNLRAKQNAGTLEASLHGDDRGGKVTILPDDDERVVEIIKRKSQLSHTAAPPPSKPNRRPPKKEFVRPKEKENQPPEPAPLPKSTSVVQDKGHLVSLSELLQNTNYPNKFRTKVKVIDYYPRDIRHFSRVFCTNCGTHCPVLSSNRCAICRKYGLEFLYHFVLIVADQTSACGIPLLVHGSDAKLIFGDYGKAKNLLEDMTALKTVYTKMQTLLKSEGHEMGVGAFVVRDSSGQKVPTWRLLTIFDK